MLFGIDLAASKKVGRFCAGAIAKILLFIKSCYPFAEGRFNNAPRKNINFGFGLDCHLLLLEN